MKISAAGRLAFILGILFCAQYPVLAQNIFTTPSSVVAAEGHVVELELWMDFRARETAGGSVDLVYDPLQLEFIEFKSSIWNAFYYGSFTVPVVTVGRIRNLGFILTPHSGIQKLVHVGTARFRKLDDSLATTEFEQFQNMGFYFEENDSNFFTLLLDVPMQASQVLPDSSVNPVLSVTPPTLDFGVVNSGTALHQLLALSAPLDRSIEFGSVVSVLPLEPQFSVGAENCSNTVLAAGQTCNVFMRYLPMDLDRHTQVMGFGSEDGEDVFYMELTGRTAMPIVKAPATAFAESFVGVHLPILVEIENVGELSLSVFDISISNTGGGNGGLIIIEDDCEGQSIPSGQSCLVVVNYIPGFPGLNVTRDLIIETNDPLNPEVRTTLTGHSILDEDNDGVNDTLDNCLMLGNPQQRDTDGDGYGNFCDADFSQDNIVNFVDYALLFPHFFSDFSDTDLNGDGVTNFIDYSIAIGQFGLPPGPSAIAGL